MNDTPLDRYIDRLEATAVDLAPRVAALEAATFGDERAGHPGLVHRLKDAQAQITAHDEFLKSAKVLASVAKWMGFTSAASTVALVAMLIKLLTGVMP